ncbi:MAG: hypothetical protein ACK58L_16875 [Planctomycetota bacterium]
MDFDVRPYNLVAGVQGWLLLVGVLFLISVGLAFVLSVARNGTQGVAIFTRGFAGFFGDLLSISPRRVFALTSLTLKEAIRRKALLIFVVFSIVLMFGGWFITNANERAELQVSVHVTFILTAIAWLILPAVIFLSCWAVPEDIRIRSMHTVVTKPARRLEIVMGRMFGMSVVTVIVLVVMAVAGYIWVVRQIPASSRNQLTCRVPAFGELYFLDQTGQPSLTGINVGDVWTYRSHIAGNSRARAIWTFFNFDESALISESPANAASRLVPLEDGSDESEWLKLECRFEAFRTVKGSEKSVREGIQAQYTLASNPREEAFEMLSRSEALRPLADALRDGQFRNGAKLLRELTERIRTAPEELRLEDYFGLQNGFDNAAGALSQSTNEQVKKVSDVCLTGAKGGIGVVTTLSKGASDPPPYDEFADALDQVAAALEENADLLHESLPRLEVPLPSFHISEYNEGAEENVKWIPRRLRFSADFETLARFLAGIFDEWNASGKLVEGSELKSNLAETLTSDARISASNASLLVQVIQEQLKSGTLKIEGGKLATADSRRWFVFFDDLIRRELLISQDNEGWVLEKDLIRDLAANNRLRIEVACINDQMYLGMARPDLFIRKADRSFASGYSKAIVNIALMLLLIIVLGVTVSCTVKGPVALFFTLTFFLVGQFFHGFMLSLLAGQEGMGTIESAVLIAQHRNPQVGMDTSNATQTVINAVDQGLLSILRVFSNIVPDFQAFNSAAAFVENGFDVPFRECVLPAIAIFAGFLIPCILLAGAMLKFRELEAK